MARPGLDRYRSFLTRNIVTGFRDQVAGPISVWFVVFELFVLAFAVLSLTVRRQGLRPWAMFLALVTLAFPTVTFLAGLLRVDHLGYAGFTVSLFAASILLAAVVQQVGFRLVRREDPRSAMVPPLLLVALLWVMLIGDIFTGGRLQIDTVFGYSPVVAGRFAGYGNLAFAPSRHLDGGLVHRSVGSGPDPRGHRARAASSVRSGSRHLDLPRRHRG